VAVRWRAAGGAAAAGIFFKQKKFFPEWIRKLSGKGKDTETAQTPWTPLSRVCDMWHSGEGLFPVSRFPGASSPSVALGEGFPEWNRAFPECNRHSWKPLAPIVPPFKGGKRLATL
jgi:hypothetical protein